MKIDDFFQSKLFQGIILGIAGLIILGFVFGIGVLVGTRRADFSFRWAEQYHRNFAGPKGGFLGEIIGPDKEFTSANGCFGEIIKIDNNILIVKDINNVEKNILVGEKTTIVFQRKNIKLSDIKIGDRVVIIGSANDEGQIEAALIRVIPPPPVSIINPRKPIRTN